MFSASTRQILLDLLHDVLKEPENYGDKFLVQIVRGSKDGMISTSSLQNMVVALNEYPIAYILHCIPLDENRRFRQSCDRTKVGLMSHPLNLETNEFGYFDDEDEVINDAVNKDKEQQSIYTQLTNLEELSLQRDSVMPIVYIDGKFYADDEYKKDLSPISDLDVPKFYYDILDMTPLGLNDEIDPFRSFLSFCFNCKGNHKQELCTLPLNKPRVARNKKIFYQIKRQQGKGRRLYMELELQEQTNKVAPGVLSERLRNALGMSNQDDEPSYYPNMRTYGYPPGYLGKEGYQIPHGSQMTLEDIINKKAPLLKVYTGDEMEECGDIEETQTNTNDKPENVQLVYYPGLNFIDTTSMDKRVISHTNVLMPNGGDVQRYWESYYAQQEQYYQSQHISQSENIHPPGTSDTNISYHDSITFNAPLTNQVHFTNNIVQVSNYYNPHMNIHADDDDESEDMDISSDDGN